jgi:hypothetical protein
LRMAKVQLSILRDIGWTRWNPIGLNREGDCEDEYDAYMRHVAALLSNGSADVDAADYLIDIEIRHMGLSQSSSTNSRAWDTVAAVRSHLGSLTI